MLGDLGVHGRHPGDVDDRVLGAGVDQGLEQLLHHDLRARGVEGADQRQADDAVPQLHHGGGELEKCIGLLGDHLFAGLGVRLEHQQADVVDEAGEIGEESVGLGVTLGLEDRQDGLLDGEDADGGLGRAEALPGTGAGQVGEEPAERGGALGARLVAAALAGRDHAVEHLVDVALELGHRHPAGQRTARHGDPFLDDRRTVLLEQLPASGCGCVAHD